MLRAEFAKNRPAAALVLASSNQYTANMQVATQYAPSPMSPRRLLRPSFRECQPKPLLHAALMQLADALEFSASCSP